MERSTYYCINISKTHLMDCECMLTYVDLFDLLSGFACVEKISKACGNRVYFKTDPDCIDYIRTEFEETIRALFPASAQFCTIIEAGVIVKTRKEEREEGLQR